MTEEKRFPLEANEGGTRLLREVTLIRAAFDVYYTRGGEIYQIRENGMIAAEIYEAREKLVKLYPALDIHVVRSGRCWRHYVVGARPKGSDGIHVWLWTPMDGFPDEVLQLKLTLIS